MDSDHPGRCPACGIGMVDQFMACSGEIQWRIDCPECGDEGFPSRYGVRLSQPEAEFIMRNADNAERSGTHYG